MGAPQKGNAAALAGATASGTSEKQEQHEDSAASPGAQYAVICIKAGGARVEFKRYESRDEAETIRLTAARNRLCCERGAAAMRPAYSNSPPSQAPAGRAAPAQVARLRRTARCLDLSPVFVGDMPLAAELFNGHGQQVETWVWPC